MSEVLGGAVTGERAKATCLKDLDLLATLFFFFSLRDRVSL